MSRVARLIKQIESEMGAESEADSEVSAEREGAVDPQGRLRLIFRQATSRYPTRAEATVLLELLERRLAQYKKQPAQAAKLMAVGASPAGGVDKAQLAAWTMVASTILNLDETITKE